MEQYKYQSGSNDAGQGPYRTPRNTEELLANIRRAEEEAREHHYGLEAVHLNRRATVRRLWRAAIAEKVGIPEIDREAKAEIVCEMRRTKIRIQYSMHGESECEREIIAEISRRARAEGIHLGQISHGDLGFDEDESEVFEHARREHAAKRRPPEKTAANSTIASITGSIAKILGRRAA